MSKAIFLRKCTNIINYRDDVFDYDTEKHGSQYVIEKEIKLDKNEFEEYTTSLLDDKDFITENNELMYVDSNGAYHCLAITCDDYDYKILVESEGYDYARYLAIINKEGEQ